MRHHRGCGAGGHVAVLAALTALALLAGRAQASPLDLFGFGARSPGMAGAGVATATGYEAVYLNPAGLADATRKRMTMGLMGGDLFLYRDGARTSTDAVSGLIIGGALPLPLGGALRDRVGLGLGFHVPLATINRARHPLPGQPVHVLLESRSHVVALQGALGLELGPRWRIGLGVLALAELGGAIDVTTDAAGRFTTFSEQQLLTRVAPIAGVRYRVPARELLVGLTVRGVSRSDYRIAVTNDLGDSLPLTIPPVLIAGVAQYDPLTVAAEAAWRWRPSLELSAQLAYQRWSAFPLPTTNPVEGTPPQEEPGFHDIAVPRLAAEWSPFDHVTVRGGYSFFYSPAPEMSGRQSLLDNHRHVAALGVGLAWPDAAVPLHIDAWVQAHRLLARSHTKDPARFAGDEELPFDTLRTRGSIVVGGLTLGVEL